MSWDTFWEWVQRIAEVITIITFTAHVGSAAVRALRGREVGSKWRTFREFLLGVAPDRDDSSSTDYSGGLLGALLLPAVERFQDAPARWRVAIMVVGVWVIVITLFITGSL